MYVDFLVLFILQLCPEGHQNKFASLTPAQPPVWMEEATF